MDEKYVLKRGPIAQLRLHWLHGKLIKEVRELFPDGIHMPTKYMRSEYGYIYIDDPDERMEYLAAMRDKIVACGYEWDHNGILEARYHDIISELDLAKLRANLDTVIYRL